MKRFPLVTAGLAAAVLGPVVVTAPRPRRLTPEGVETIEQAVENCRASGKQGWELVDHATHLVNRKYSFYSAYHWWETPAQSFDRSRGQSNQYNTALARVLRALGFTVRTVHAARVRLDDAPWWHVGHTWLHVSIGGETRDVCASRIDNVAGDVEFTPMTPARPFRGLTYVDTTLGLAPIAVAATWRSWLDHRPLPRWLYRPFGESVMPQDAGPR